MAEEETITTEPAISSDLTFSEDDLTALEDEFKTPEEEEEEEEDEPAEDEDQDADEEEGGGVKEEDEEGEEGTVDAGDGDGGDKQAAEEETDAEAAAKVKEEANAEGYELIVDGKPVLVETEDQLAAWAQKGIHYEKSRLQMEKRIEDATFTMNALVNDPLASLEEIWTHKFSGNHEQARAHVQKLCEGYLEPIWKELTAEPAKRLELQQERFQKRSMQDRAQQEQKQAGQFTQEDIQFIQQLDQQIAHALDDVGLPKEDVTLRKWMSDVMRDGLGRGIHPDPRAAAEFIKSQQAARQESLGNSAPVKDRKKTGAKAKAQKIAKAKQRRSQRQGGEKMPQGKGRREPQYMSSRQWLDGLNHDLNLEP